LIGDGEMVMRNRRQKSARDIVRTLKQHNTEVRKRFHIKKIGVFGSYVRNEQKKGSDIDILVEFEPGYKTFDNYMDFKFFLEALLHSKVDLVVKTAIRDEIRERVLSEAVYV